ncbi:MAG: regulatory protein RecX [Pseudomonadales bacterium]|nr:regulatory protein RecX [Pseudomonadales bacterium]
MRPTPELTLARLKGHAAACLAGRELSAEELRQKLLHFGGDSDVVEQVLEEFRVRGWQDDHRVLELQQRMAERRGWGPLRLRQHLQSKGLAPDLIADGLQAQDTEDWIERGLSLLLVRFSSPLSQDDRTEAKIMRFLAYRGYSRGQALQAIKRWKLLVAEQHPSEYLPGDQG